MTVAGASCYPASPESGPRRFRRRSEPGEPRRGSRGATEASWRGAAKGWRTGRWRAPGVAGGGRRGSGLANGRPCAYAWAGAFRDGCKSPET